MSQLARDFMSLLLAEVAKSEISSAQGIDQCRARHIVAGSSAFFSARRIDEKELH